MEDPAGYSARISKSSATDI